MTPEEMTSTRAKIRAESIEQAEKGVFVCEQNLIKVEAHIAVKTQALGSISALDPRRRASMRRSIQQEIMALSDHKANLEWYLDEYTQRMSGAKLKPATLPPREKTHSKSGRKPGRPRKDDLRQQAQVLRDKNYSWSRLRRTMNKLTGEDKSENAYRNLLNS